MWRILLRGMVLAVVFFWAIESVRAAFHLDCAGVGPVRPLIPFLGGIIGYFVVWMSLLRSRRFLVFWETTDHELMHALGAVLCLRQVRSLASQSSGNGSVLVERPNALITMMPYLVSGPLLVSMLLVVIASESWKPLTESVLGVALGYHVFRLVRTVRPQQDDLQLLSFPISLLLTISVLAILLFFCFGLVQDASGGVSEYVERTLSLVVRDVRVW